MEGFFLTLCLLAFSFILKVFINKKPKIMDILKAISELPIDIMFTSIAFIISYRIAQVAKWINENKKITDGIDMNMHFIYLILYLIISVIVIILWTKSVHYLKKEIWKTSIILIIISYLISFSALIFALVKLNGVV